MLRKFFLVALTFAASFGSFSFASAAPQVGIPMNLEYQLEPNIPQTFTNFMFWTLTGTCSITQSEVEQNPLFVNLLSKKGWINGQEFNAGESLAFTARTGEDFELTAESGAQVELVNRVEKTVTMICRS